jgi:hypothetical protein
MRFLAPFLAYLCTAHAGPVPLHAPGRRLERRVLAEVAEGDGNAAVFQETYRNLTSTDWFTEPPAGRYEHVSRESHLERVLREAPQSAAFIKLEDPLTFVEHPPVKIGPQNVTFDCDGATMLFHAFPLGAGTGRFLRWHNCITIFPDFALAADEPGGALSSLNSSHILFPCEVRHCSSPRPLHTPGHDHCRRVKNMPTSLYVAIKARLEAEPHERWNRRKTVKLPAVLNFWRCHSEGESVTQAPLL